ncbi:cytochrome P450 [Glycomyces salinus]|uniref:cytochrome P450 n=1 Tax=Glycomyces salinus TaxID=980294 RepID=UPI0018EDBBDF|nr:cytochrome P450 [Glycomyces salinus]
MLFELWKHSHPASGVFRQDGQVVVAEHRLAKRVLADAERFSPANALDAITPIPAAALRELTRHRFRLPPTLANNGSDSHERIRSLFGEVFEPSKVEALRPWLTGLVRRTVGAVAWRLRQGEPVDLDSAVSSQIPLAALSRLMGLELGEAGEVKRFSRAALELFWGRPGPERQLELAGIVGPYHRLLRSYTANASSTLGAVRDREGEEAATAALFFLLVAGQETTSQFLTVLAHQLIERPELLDARPAAVVEEGLRLHSSITSWRRVAAVDTEIGGLPVKAGESILVWLTAAGADEGVAECPHRMVPGQKGSRRHLAFGAGAHRCLGSQLSRMESEVVIAELGPLLRRCEVVKPPVSDDNLSFRMPSPLLVAIRLWSCGGCIPAVEARSMPPNPAVWPSLVSSPIAGRRRLAYNACPRTTR